MKDVIDEIDSRIKSPLFGYFLFSLIAINWKEFFFLFFAKSTAIERIKFFGDGTDVMSLLLYPFLLAAIYSVLYPWLQYIFLRLATKPTELKNSLQADSEHKLLIRKQELEEIRSEMLSNVEKELIARAKRDEELKTIEDQDTREKLQSEIDKLRRNRDELRESLNKEGADISKTSLHEEQLEILKRIASDEGSVLEENFLSNSGEGLNRVQAEYFVEDMIEKNLLYREYNPTYNGYFLKLTTSGKKIALDIR